MPFLAAYDGPEQVINLEPLRRCARAEGTPGLAGGARRSFFFYFLARSLTRKLNQTNHLSLLSFPSLPTSINSDQPLFSSYYYE
jgi:hypothetical protein